MSAKLRDFFTRVPDTVTTFNFNNEDLLYLMDEDLAEVEEILNATTNSNPDLICFCTGNGTPNDWIVGSKIICKLEPHNDLECNIIPLELIPSYDILIKILEHDLDSSVCLDLGDNVILTITDSEDVRKLSLNSDVLDVPQGVYQLYTGNYIRSHLLHQSPYVIKYDNFLLSIGSKGFISVGQPTFGTDGKIVIGKPSSTQKNIFNINHTQCQYY